MKRENNILIKGEEEEKLKTTKADESNPRQGTYTNIACIISVSIRKT